MAVKNITAANWNLTARSDARRYSKQDVTAPPAPANPVMTAGLDWIEFDCDESVDPQSTISGYTCQWGTAAGGPYPNVATPIAHAAFPLRITGLASGLKYGKITATNAFDLTTALADCTQVSAEVNPGGEEETYLFFDDFNYAVSRGSSGVDTGKAATFAAAGWNGFKDETTQSGQSRGFLSTATSIPGYSGSIPGGGRMLRIEALPTTYGQQTDFYLGLGSGIAGDIPANVWFQHWMYINRSGAEMSAFSGIRNKWLYPKIGGSGSGYPMGNPDTAWLCNIGSNRYEGTLNVAAPVAGAMTFRTHAEPVSSGVNRAYKTDQVTTGNFQQMTPRGLASENDHWLFPNTMYLVKYNFDVAQNPGSHRIWWREYGQHVAGFGNPRSQWIEGVTTGFTYDTYAADHLGGKRLRIPTTVSVGAGPSSDFYIYIKDFAMAATEGGLPTYGY